MILVKILERKGVIRFFGISLMVAPLFNILATLLSSNDIPDKWSWAAFWEVATSGSFTYQIPYIASFIIGTLMLRGSKAAWKYALVLLGVDFIWQLAHLHVAPDALTNWLSAIFILVNAVSFLFIADQLVWKVKLPEVKLPDVKLSEIKLPNLPSIKNSSLAIETPIKKVVENTKPATPTVHTPTAQKPILKIVQPEPEPKRTVALVSRKKLVGFSGFGPWAQLVSVSSTGIELRCLNNPPVEFGQRTIEINLSVGLNLKIRLARQTGSAFYFEYTNISNDQLTNLNRWLKVQIQTAA